MAKRAKFGGDWTEEKLNALAKYLKAYTTIFNGNEGAAYYTTTYVDAFASTGSVQLKASESLNGTLFDDDERRESRIFCLGSVRRALEIAPKFDKYLFIERNQTSYTDLLSIKSEYPELAESIEIVNADANAYLIEWCKRIDWKTNRAVIFLDPFGMQVEWRLLEEISKAGGTEIWLLFPLGMGVNRLLTKNEPPPQNWADTLTRTLGTEEWREYFYSRQLEESLFGESDVLYTKVASFEKIASYIVTRLKTLFPGVAENPLVLSNSRNNPMYLLCFATSNPAKTELALKIAQDVLRRRR